MANNWATLRGKDEVLATLDKIERDLVRSGKLLDWGGPRIRAAVVTRTMQGKDVHDRDFVPYSDMYAALKGRRSPVTLAGTATSSGIGPVTMLNQLVFERTGPTAGKVFVASGGTPDRAGVAEAHNRGLGRLPERRWMGMSKADMQVLNADTLDWVDEQLGHVARESGGTIRKVGRAVSGVGWKVSSQA